MTLRRLCLSVLSASVAVLCFVAPPAARADCPAAPLTDPDDMVVSFLSSTGTQTGAGSLFASTVKEGMLVYDDTANALKICNGTAWQALDIVGSTASSQWVNGTGGAIYYNGGKVGIGTTTPSELLHLNAGSGGTARNIIKLHNSGWGTPTANNVTSSNGTKLDLFSTSNQGNQIGMDAAGYMWFRVGGSQKSGYNWYTVSDDTSTPTVKMAMLNGGNVGIGTTSPQARLDVAGEVRMASTGLACSATTEGTQRYNSTAKTIEFCNGSVWASFFSQAVQPNAFSFADVTGASLGATVTSNAVTLGGFPGTLTATCSGCTAIARNGAWGGTVVNGFASGDTIAIRVTASGSHATAVTASAAVGGTTSGTWTVTTISNSGPNAFSFTDVADATTNITYTSNAVTLAGFSGALSATCNDCTGIARNGVWGVSPLAGFVAGDTIAIRQTSPAGAGSTGTAAVKLGSTTSGNWAVTTMSACAVGITVGQACPDGSLYAGFSPDGNVPMYTTPCDAGQALSGSCTGTRLTKSWNSGTSNWTVTGFTSALTGLANTAGLVALVDAGAPYNAAAYCDGLSDHGKTDWYLPAKNELAVLYANRVALGGFDTGGGQWYWSASENLNYNAWIQRFSDGYQTNGNKNNGYYVRCVRR